MSFREKDYLKKQLEEVARAVARILGFKDAGNVSEARAELERSARTLLGVGLSPLDRVDVRSAVNLLRSHVGAESYAQLLEAQAALEDPDAAKALLARAKGIRDAAGLKD